MAKSKPGKVAVVWCWPKHKKIPKGWKFSADLGRYHGQYSILIEKVE